MNKPAFLGIDLGTTNSTAALFDGARITSVRNPLGGFLTPSIVRIDGRGNVAVGARARRFLQTDPRNTHSEFKRLMGTEQTLDFPALGVSKRPEELASEILKAIRRDVLDQFGFSPHAAVISVPALFEVPQTSATSEAARLAGFARVELVQEPIASAIAAGWSAAVGDENWLVYDLGGGTFDVALLAARDGVLSVIGVDGDNFLGGRDFDTQIVGWAITEIWRLHGVSIDWADPAHAAAIQELRHAAEDAKIELARAEEAEVLIPLLDVGGKRIDVNLTLTRALLDELVASVIDRTLVVCRRLLVRHGMPPIGRILAVGGPAVMPVVRSWVAEALQAPLHAGHDPMTIVAQGAALHAAAVGLDAHPSAAATPRDATQVWLQYPAVTSNFWPVVLGKILDPADRGKPGVAKVVVRRDDGQWTSGPRALGADGAFAVTVQVAMRRPNVFHVEGILPSGETTVLHPSTLTIVHGVLGAEATLSRSIGVALANDTVTVYFPRGSPLPARRTFTFHTVEAVSREVDGFALRIPLVQGEFPHAHLCRLVGALEIPSSAINASILASTPIDVTLELDRSGRLSAAAHVAALQQMFDQVEHLVAPLVPVEKLAEPIAQLRARASSLRSNAVRLGLATALAKLDDLDKLFALLMRDIAAARGGDSDAAEKARRALLEIDSALGEVHADLAWPLFERTLPDRLARALNLVSQRGTEAERKLLDDTLAAIERTRLTKDIAEILRLLDTVGQVEGASHNRHLDSWRPWLEYWESRVTEAADARRARVLVQEAKQAMQKGDRRSLDVAVRALRPLLPADPGQRRLAYSSGVR
jgi:molecular chaperone DnaK